MRSITVASKINQLMLILSFVDIYVSSKVPPDNGVSAGEKGKG